MIATEADISLIVDLAMEAHRGSVWEDVGTRPNPESIAASVRSLLDRDNAAVFVSKRGVLMLAAFPLWFDHSETVVSEIFFFATEGGDALRREGEAWAAGRLLTMCRHEKTDPRLDKLYARAGYQPIERTFIRRA